MNSYVRTGLISAGAGTVVVCSYILMKNVWTQLLTRLDDVYGAIESVNDTLNQFTLKDTNAALDGVKNSLDSTNQTLNLMTTPHNPKDLFDAAIREMVVRGNKEHGSKFYELWNELYPDNKMN